MRISTFSDFHHMKSPPTIRVRWNWPGDGDRLRAAERREIRSDVPSRLHRRTEYDTDSSSARQMCTECEIKLTSPPIVVTFRNRLLGRLRAAGGGKCRNDNGQFVSDFVH